MAAPTTMQWIRQAAHRLSVGSARRTAQLTTATLHRARHLWQRATGWLGEASGLSWVLRAAVLAAAALLARKAAVALSAAVYARVESGQAWWLLWGAAIAWTVAAYRAGAPGWVPEQSAAPSEEAPAAQDGDEQAPMPDGNEPPAPPAEQAPPERSVSPVALVAAVRDIGTPHAQLKPLAEHLGVSTDAVRAAAAGMGWTVKDVRMAGRSASAGLRWDEVPSPAPTDPVPGVVGAGQCADDNDDDTGEEGAEKGVRVVRTDGGLIVYDLADTHRHHQVTDH
jgi:hypothetical protein